MPNHKLPLSFTAPFTVPRRTALRGVSLTAAARLDGRLVFINKVFLPTSSASRFSSG
jgi:uncharacterized lipoprotein YbaY